MADNSMKHLIALRTTLGTIVHFILDSTERRIEVVVGWCFLTVHNYVTIS